MSEPPPVPPRVKVNDTMQKLVECYQKINKLQEELLELEGQKMTEEFKAQQRLITIKSLKEKIESSERLIESYRKLIETMEKNRTESQKLENYYVNPHLTDISAHGTTIPDAFFKVPDGITIYALAPIGKCTTFGDSDIFFEHIKKGNLPSTSEVIRGGIYKSGDVMFDVDLEFTDIKKDKNSFMHMGVFPYFAKPLYISYQQIKYWFDHREDEYCSDIVDKLKDSGPKDEDDIEEVEDCVKKFVLNQGDVRPLLRNIRREDDLKLSQLIYYIWRYIKTDKGKRKHIPPTIVLDACLSFTPSDESGAKTAKLVTQLEEFKENPDVVNKLGLTFEWPDFMTQLRQPLTRSSSIHRFAYKR